MPLPAVAHVEISRSRGKLIVEIRDFISPTIVDRLDVDVPLFRAKIPDWRAMVDCVMVDTAWDGEVFNVVHSDVPERKDELVHGRYEWPRGRTKDWHEAGPAYLRTPHMRRSPRPRPE